MESDNICSKADRAIQIKIPQRILVFQQNGSAESKIAGIREFGQGLFDIEVISIDEPLPGLIEDSRAYLPKDFSADVVLDFLRHPDLSLDLARLCHKKNIPIVASGKKHTDKWAFKPPT
ncbi:conserved hypothetical protein [uncultured Desulfobacterium sp.]|uniref:Uncharacterized protein n=1 Tax=uncultured Desulfobacterium sp. TaxID=201089 RepID=A0A445N2R9_9BACT|nr:conserved hypothetical protein [uncultured Desulfobacterium sp.]